LNDLIVVSGPSGVGKGTLISGLLKADPTSRVTVSDTTRQIRQGEENGKDYNFITSEEFKARIDAGYYVEWEHFYDTYYGTPKNQIESAKPGEKVLLELDPKGALSIKRAYPDAALVFVLPATMGQLAERLRARGTENSRQLQLRAARVAEEMALIDHFDYAVVNDDITKATADFCELVSSLRFRMQSNRNLVAKLLLEAKELSNDLH